MNRHVPVKTFNDYLPATTVTDSKNKAFQLKANCPLANRCMGERGDSHVVGAGLEG